VIDIMRGGPPPLDYETVEERAMSADYGSVDVLVAGLSSIVGFKLSGVAILFEVKPDRN